MPSKISYRAFSSCTKSVKKNDHELGAVNSSELWVCRLQVIQVFSNHVLSVFLLSHDSFPL